MLLLCVVGVNMDTDTYLLELFFLHEGKGPEKEKYEEKIKRLRLKRVAFRTMWLSAEDYPLLLGRLPHCVLCMLFRMVDLINYLSHLQDRQTWVFACILHHQG